MNTKVIAYSRLDLSSCMSVSKLSDSLDCSSYYQTRNYKMNRTKPTRRTVSFGTISHRLYDRTVGLHPAVSSCPALDFTWNYRTLKDTTVDEHESARIPLRRSRTKLIITKTERENLLKYEWEVPPRRIARCALIVNRTKDRRNQTVQNWRLEKIEEKLQQMTRALYRLLGMRKPYQEELKDLWKAAEDSHFCDHGTVTTAGSHSNNETQIKKSLLKHKRFSTKRRMSNTSTNSNLTRHNVDFDLLGAGACQEENIEVHLVLQT
mmetsp:Transcript_9960/g.12619  ORF Transcript_9960/g.12619 Transcript_9960/m.12619 type:complete len:264 (+) Transcript_9960:58-849(+)